MSKRKRTPRSARSRISKPRQPSAEFRRSAGKRSAPASGTGLWLYGVHAVSEALKNPARIKHRLVYTSNVADQLSAILRESDFDTDKAEVSDRSDIDAICGPDAVHQGVALHVSPLPDIAIEDVVNETPSERDIIVVLDQATDPRNIGAVMRSARAFGASAVVLQDRNAPPETAVMAKAASGALEHIALVRVTNLARTLWTLKDADYWCIGLDGTAEDSLSRVTPGPRTVVVMGAEGAGLRRLTRETCDQLVRIPIAEDSESLNLSNAAAIALFVLSQ